MSQSSSSVVRAVFFGVAALAVALPASWPSVARADGPPPLPPEAFAACASKSEGDACSVSLRDRTLEGKCAPDHGDGRLFCMPSSPRPRPDDPR